MHYLILWFHSYICVLFYIDFPRGYVFCYLFFDLYELFPPMVYNVFLFLFRVASLQFLLMSFLLILFYSSYGFGV